MDQVYKYEESIDGRIYTTESSYKVAEYWNGFSKRHHFAKEVLYKEKKTNSYFLYIYGDLAEYGLSVTQKIVPVEKEEADEWVETKIENEDSLVLFESYFFDMETAKEIGRWKNECSTGILYATSNGEYYIFYDSDELYWPDGIGYRNCHTVGIQSALQYAKDNINPDIEIQDLEISNA